MGGISNYVYSTILLIKKFYIFFSPLFYFSFVIENTKPTYVDCLMMNSIIYSCILWLLNLYGSLCFMNGMCFSVQKVLVSVKAVPVKNDYIIHQKFQLHRYQEMNEFLYGRSFSWKKSGAYIGYDLMVRIMPTLLLLDIESPAFFF